MKFVFAADLHLSLITWNKLPEVRMDSLLSFKQLLEYCEDNRCPLVLGGDVFDSVRMTPELLNEVLRIRSNHPDVTIYFINGNHDLVKPSWSMFLRNCHHLSSEPLVTELGTRLCGIDFKLSEEFPEAISKVYPFCDYLIVHQTFDKLSNNLPGSLDSSPLKDFRCVLAGDYHVTVHKDNIYSPGSTNRRSISEGIGNALVIQDDDSITNLSLETRPLIQVSTETPFDEALNKLGKPSFVNKELEKGIIVVRGEITPDIKTEWETAIGEEAYLLFVPKSKESEEVHIEGSATVARGSKIYILDMLSKYPCSDGAKRVITDYLASPDKMIENVREKLK